MDLDILDVNTNRAERHAVHIQDVKHIGVIICIISTTQRTRQRGQEKTYFSQKCPFYKISTYIITNIDLKTKSIFHRWKHFDILQTIQPKKLEQTQWKI